MAIYKSIVEKELSKLLKEPSINIIRDYYYNKIYNNKSLTENSKKTYKSNLFIALRNLKIAEEIILQLKDEFKNKNDL